jgi:hypothetical protein
MRRLVILAVLVCAIGVVPSAGAVIGGTRDGEAHPYVAFAGDPVTRAACTATLISPTLAVTAGHCFAPGATVLVFPYADGPAGGPPLAGQFFRHPDFCKPPACTGDPSSPAFFVTDDVGVIVLMQPATLPRYASLPKLERSQGKGAVQKHVGKDVELLGYGVQGFAPAPFSDFTRTVAREEIAAPLSLFAERFVQVDQDRAGFCLGDSGGPLIEKKDVVLAISSVVADTSTCLGPSLAYRLDSEPALSFIRSFQ